MGHYSGFNITFCSIAVAVSVDFCISAYETLSPASYLPKSAEVFRDFSRFETRLGDGCATETGHPS